MIYLNMVKLEKQIHGFVRKSVIIEVGLTRSQGLERVEGWLDESKVFEVSKGSWSMSKEGTEMSLDNTNG